MPKSFLIAQKRASKRKRDARPTDDEAGSKKRLLKPQNITGKLYDSESRVPPIIPLERLHIVTKTLPETTAIPQHRPPSPTAQYGPYGMPLPAPTLGAVPEYSQQSCSPEYDSLTGRYHDHHGLITQNKDHRQIFAHFPSDNITVYKSENPEAMCTQSPKTVGYGDRPCTTASPKVTISKDESHTADDSGYRTSCSLYSPLTSSDDDVSAADDNDEHVDEVNERQRAPPSSPYSMDVHGLDPSSSSSSSSSSLTYAATTKDTGEEIIECSDSDDISVGDEDVDTSFTCEPKYTKAVVESDMAITYSQHLENVIRGSLEPSRLTNRQPLQPIVITPQCSGNSRYEDRHQSSRKRICYDNIPLNSPDAPKSPLVSPVFGQPTIHNYHDPRFWLESSSTPMYSNMGVSYPAIYPSLDRYRTYPFSYPHSRSSELVHNLHSRYQKHPVEQKHGFEFMPHLNVPRHELRCAVSPAEKPNNISHSITNLLSSPELSDTATSPKSTTPLNMDNQHGHLMDDYPQYACPDCKKSYSSHSGLAKHRQQKCLPDEKKQFTCKHCSKVYTSLGALKMHIRTHTLPCKCHICGKAFSRPWLLQGHIRTHTGEKPFSCQHCNRSFADRSNLRAHLQTHTEVKKYSCKKCTKTFSRMSLLLKHDDGGCSG